MLLFLSVIGISLWEKSSKGSAVWVSEYLYLLFVVLAPWIHQIQIRAAHEADSFSIKLRFLSLEDRLFSKRTAGSMLLYVSIMTLFQCYQYFFVSSSIYIIINVLIFLLPVVHLILFWNQSASLADIYFASMMAMLYFNEQIYHALDSIEMAQRFALHNMFLYLLSAVLYSGIWIIGGNIYRKVQQKRKNQIA